MFVDDANIVQASVNAPISIESLFYKSSTISSEEDVKSFLAKPRIIQSGLFQAADVVSTFPPLNLPSAMVALPVVANKLSGFLGFRATTVLTLQINGNRFQQGRYMLCFVSTGGDDPTNVNSSAWILAHENSLVQRTQLPRVELDVNCDTIGVLRIPWVSVHNFYLLPTNSTRNYSIGQVQIFPYSPLIATSGPTSLGYTLWAHFEDIELIGPANPQMNSTDHERKSHGVGPITSVLAKTQTALNIWADVPLLSSYTRSASWFVDLCKRTTSVFGWSKPSNLAALTRVTRTPLLWSGNVDNSDDALPTALSVSNEVISLPGFSGTNVDEMDFSHIATIPSNPNSILAWNSTQVSGTQLLLTQNGPAFFAPTRTGLGGKVFTDFTPLAFVANFFNYWRGGITYRLKFVKTEFHSGRLVVAFFPQAPQQAGTTINLVQSDYIHREIIDIREKNEVTLTVPYIAPNPFTLNSTTSFGSTGYLAIFVLDPLVAPSTVSSTINILVEVAGAPDFEVAFPSSSSVLTPVMNAVPQSGVRSDCALVSKNIGTSQAVNDGYSNAAACIGERVSSFRTLLKSASWRGGTGIPASAAGVLILPYAIGAYNNALVAPLPALSGDVYGAVASCYGLSRGGVRIRYPTDFPTATISNSTVISFVSFYNATATAEILYPTVKYNPIGNMVTQNSIVERGVSVAVPQYEQRHSRANAAQIVNSAIPYAAGPNGLASPVCLNTIYFGDATYSTNARSGSDDLNFGQFISIPPMTVVSPQIA